MAITERLQILVEANAKGAQREFQKFGREAEREIGKTDQKLRQLSGQFTSFGVSALAAGGIAAAGLFKAAEAAGDLGEAQNKANVILGDEGARVLREFADEASRTAGLSKRAATDGASQFAQFGKAAGLAGVDLADFSVDLTQLAGDLASFNNTTTDEAIQAIGAGLRGESEPLRRFGVLLDDATLKARALELGIYDGNGALEQSQRVLAAQAEILEQTSDAQGDFERTSDGLANRQRQLAAEFENTKAAVGEAVLPAFEQLVGAVGGVLQGFNDLPDATKTAIGGVAGIGTTATIAAGGLSLLVGTGLRAVDNFSELRARIQQSDGVLSSAIPTFRRADGSLTRMGVAARGAGIALGTLLIADPVFDAINQGTDNLADFEDALNKVKIAAEGDRNIGLFDAFAESVAAEQNILRVQNLWQEFGAEIDLVGTGVKADVEQVQRTFDQLDPAAGEAALDALERRTDALDRDSRQYQINTEFIERNRESLRLQVEASEAGADAAGELGGELEQSAEQTERASDATKEYERQLGLAAAKQELLGLKTKAAAEEAKAFEDALDASSIIDDTLQSSLELQDVFADLVFAAGQIPSEIDFSQLNLDDFGDDAQDALRTVLSFGDTARRAVAQALEFEGADRAREVAAQLRDQFTTIADNAGVADESIQQLLESIGLTNPQIEVAIAVSGEAETFFVIEQLRSIFKDEIEGQPGLEMLLAAKFRDGDFEAVRGILEAATQDLTDGSINNPIILAAIADVTGAQEDLDEFRRVAENPSAPIIPQLALDDSRARRTYSEFQRAVLESPANASVNLITADAERRWASVKSTLEERGLRIPVFFENLQASILEAPANRSPAPADRQGRALGGPVRMGEPYIVGEYEPEVFVPNANGRILNQEQLRAELSATQRAAEQAALRGRGLAVAAPSGQQVASMVAQVERFLADAATNTGGVTTGPITINTDRPEQTAPEVIRGLRKAAWLEG